MTPTTLTAAVLVLNEAHQLPSLLASLRWCDELLVVDGGSTDGSAETARREGARVLVRNFDNFARQRNAALDAACGDWILFIDADERPTPAFSAEVRRRLAAARAVGYRVPIRSTIFGRRFRFSGTQNDVPLRLVRRGVGRWNGAVHERFTAAGPIERLDSRLEHVTLPNVTAFLEKMHRYTELNATARVARGEAPRWAESWIRPPREVFRRLIWKQGWLDGPEGWMFCGLSGLSEWVAARHHLRLWRRQRSAVPKVAMPALERGAA